MADSTQSGGPQPGRGDHASDKGADEELSFAFADFAEEIAADVDPLASDLAPSSNPPPLVNAEGMAEAFGQFHPEEVAHESHVGSDHFGGFIVAATEGELDSVFVSGGEPEMLAEGVVDQPFEGDSYSGNSQGYQDSPSLALQTQGDADAAAAGGAKPDDMPVVMPTPTPPARRRGIGAVGSAMLGGLCALPLTYAILIWGFQRDPLQLAPLLPGAAAFLLPTALRPGTEIAVPSPAPAAALESRPVAPQLADDLESPGVAQAGPPGHSSALEIQQEVAVDETPARASQPAGVEDKVGLGAFGEEGSLRAGAGQDLPLVPADLEAGGRKETGENSSTTIAPAAPANDHESLSPPEESLNPAVGMALAAVGRAEKKASVALQSLVEAPTQAGAQRDRLRVRWYRALAEMAGSLAAYERTAVEAGQPSVEMPGVLSLLQNTTVGDGSVQQDLEELGCMWLTSVRRTSDGAVLAGTLEEVRPSGPYWRSQVRSTRPQGTLAWSFISRDRPAADPGERVVVMGVILDDDMIWAAGCQSLRTGSETPGGG